MKVKVTKFSPYGGTIAVAVVDSEFTATRAAGEAMMARIQPYFRTIGVMLVSIEENGYRAFAPFQSAKVLALLQLEMLKFEEIDLDVPPSVEEPPPPF